MALGSTQPLTEMSTRSISLGERRPVPKTDILPLSCTVVTQSGNLNFLEPSGHLRDCNGTVLPLILPYYLSLYYKRSIIFPHTVGFSVVPFMKLHKMINICSSQFSWLSISKIMTNHKNQRVKETVRK